MLAKLKANLVLKVIIGFVAFFVLLILGIWLLGPSQLKKYIEDKDVTWVNREISIHKITFNPFTFKIGLQKVAIKEPNSQQNFIAFDDLLINIDFWELVQSKIDVQKISLNNLESNIHQNGTNFNFSDLLNSNSKETEDDSEPVSFAIHNIQVSNAIIHYKDVQLGTSITLDSINIKDQVFRSIDTVFDAELSIHQPEGGWVKGKVSYNLKNSNYKIQTSIDAWELSPFTGYVTSGIQLSEFTGQLNSNLELVGNVDNDYIKSKGEITVADFKMIDPESKPLITMGNLFIDIIQVDNKENKYDFKDILIDNTQVNFEYLQNGDNFTKWLVTEEGSSNEKHTAMDAYVSPFEMLSIYIYDMTREYIFKSYTAEKIQLTNFNLKFQDYTLEDPFYMDLEKVSIKSENIRPENNFAKFYLNGKMNGTAIMEGDLLVSRQGVENMNIDMNVKGLFLNRFSPYGREYTAHRFLEGVTSFSNKSEIKNSYLKSTNKLHIEGAEVSKKDKTRTGSSLPMRLALALMKDTKGDINLDIPIEGPINDPEYKFGKVIWQVIKNIFTKVITSPIKSLAGIFKVDEKDLKNIYFDNGQIGLSPIQKAPLNKIASVLSKKKDLKIVLNHLYNGEYELDAIALKSVKMAYLKQSNLKLDENIPIGKHAFDLPNTNPEFLEYLKKVTPNFDETISIPENARRFIGEEKIKVDLERIKKKQKELVRNYLLVDKGVEEHRFSIKDGSTSEEALNQSRPKFKVEFTIEE